MAELIVDLAQYSRDDQKLEALLDDWENLTEALEWIANRANQSEIAARARATLVELKSITPAERRRLVGGGGDG